MKAAKITMAIVLVLLTLAFLLIGIVIYFYYTQDKIDKFEQDAIINTRMALADSYNNRDWEKVVGYGMALEEYGDSLGDLTMAYAEGLAFCGEFKKARRLLLDRIKEHPEVQLDYLYQTIGEVCHIEGKTDDALTYYKKAIDVNPYYARPYVNIAGIYAEQKNIADATSSYLKAIDLFYNHNAYDESEYFSKKVLELDKNNIDALVFLAATCYKKGMDAEYEQYSEQAKRKGGINTLTRIKELVK